MSLTQSHVLRRWEYSLACSRTLTHSNGVWNTVSVAPVRAPQRVAPVSDSVPEQRDRRNSQTAAADWAAVVYEMSERHQNPCSWNMCRRFNYSVSVSLSHHQNDRVGHWLANKEIPDASANHKHTTSVDLTSILSAQVGFEKVIG